MTEERRECRLYQVDLKLDVETQQRVGQGEYWAAVLTQLGIAVYGDSRDEALAKVDDTVEVLLESFEDYPDPVAALKEYLAVHDVRYELTPQSALIHLADLSEMAPILVTDSEPERFERSVNGSIRVPVSV